MRARRCFLFPAAVLWVALRALRASAHAAMEASTTEAAAEAASAAPHAASAPAAAPVFHWESKSHSGRSHRSRNAATVSSTVTLSAAAGAAAMANNSGPQTVESGSCSVLAELEKEAERLSKEVEYGKGKLAEVFKIFHLIFSFLSSLQHISRGCSTFYCLSLPFRSFQLFIVCQSLSSF